MFGLFGRNKKSEELEDVAEAPVDRRASERSDTTTFGPALASRMIVTGMLSSTPPSTRISPSRVMKGGRIVETLTRG